jgi:hypothetical protein
MLLKVALLKYSNTTNIGDNIQTLAVEQHIDQSYDLVDRDFLCEYSGEPCAVVMNGWFTHEPQNWPPSPAIVPIFFGFHLSPSVAKYFERHKEYLSRFAPIGCRDNATAEIVMSWGIDAYVSGCATMTFPNRMKEPSEPLLVLADQTPKHLLREERRNHVVISHELPSYFSSSMKFAAARELLQFYRDRAGKVITSRIHCAIPCAAMGIPVVYTGVREGRTQVIDMVGIPSYKTRRIPRTRLSQLPFRKPSFEKLKENIVADLHRRLETHGIKVRQPLDRG